MKALFAFLILTGTAHAAVSSCAGRNDGTPCQVQCQTAGVCISGACVSGSALPDGTPCASEQGCTTGDSCQAGTCVPGSGGVSCPALDDCHPGLCMPNLGCTYDSVCPPTRRPPKTVDTSPSMMTASEPPGMPDLPMTMTGEPPSLDDSLHLHGSGLGCDMSRGGPTPLAGMLLIALALLVCRRRSL